MPSSEKESQEGYLEEAMAFQDPNTERQSGRKSERREKHSRQRERITWNLAGGSEVGEGWPTSLGRRQSGKADSQ